MSATPEKRPTSAVERWFAVVDTVFDKNKERWAEVGYAHFIAQVEQAERAAREDALEEAARVPAEAGLYGIVDRIRALKASALPPAPPPPQVSASDDNIERPVESLTRRLIAAEAHIKGLYASERDTVDRFSVHARAIAALVDRVAALESPAAPRAASEVERARVLEDVAAAARAWRSAPAHPGPLHKDEEDLMDALDALARLDAAKGGAA